jgi:hypothetical protein
MTCSYSSNAHSTVYAVTRAVNNKAKAAATSRSDSIDGGLHSVLCRATINISSTTAEHACRRSLVGAYLKHSACVLRKY